jgi:hypothetical protein
VKCSEASGRVEYANTDAATGSTARNGGWRQSNPVASKAGIQDGSNVRRVAVVPYGHLFWLTGRHSPGAGRLKRLP